ncbi:WAS/WASL-interacting protein family member 2-like isoform X1 [Oncorhynchus mykiss]|uniref:WAS/WASL-interacting protein family member 2-like isoform X1 n=1 Tax=Oncorhynchus mykiss TaxID=8022 RepID=UPI0018778095|nr:WAS/WASL-interacting protein family member 2-like isoform X1 [Oncorhynchus mykiss]
MNPTAARRHTLQKIFATLRTQAAQKWTQVLQADPVQPQVHRTWRDPDDDLSLSPPPPHCRDPDDDLSLSPPPCRDPDDDLSLSPPPPPCRDPDDEGFNPELSWEEGGGLQPGQTRPPQRPPESCL